MASYHVISGLLSFVFISSAALLLSVRDAELATNAQRAVATVVNSVRGEVQHTLADPILLTKVLGTYVELNDFSVESFKVGARHLLPENDAIRTFQIAPNAIITDSYPLAGNEEAIGRKLLHDERRAKGAYAAIRSGRALVIGPVRLAQDNSLAFIVRMPVYQNGKDFWGFVSAVLTLDKLKENLRQPLRLVEGIRYRLVGFDPDNNMQNTMLESDIPPSPESEVYSLSVEGTSWRLYIECLDEGHLLVTISVYGFAFFLSLLVFFRERLIYEKRKKLHLLNEALLRESTTDSLTGLQNRSAFTATFTSGVLEAGEVHSIAYLDIDSFKKINDTYGHKVGDCVLRTFSAKVSSLLREKDYFARWGGEEFVILMPSTSGIEAKTLCDTIVKTVADTVMTCPPVGLQITVSIGIASFFACENILDDVLSRADAALYTAKAAGKNQCVAAPV